MWKAQLCTLFSMGRSSFLPCPGWTPFPTHRGLVPLHTCIGTDLGVPMRLHLFASILFLHVSLPRPRLRSSIARRALACPTSASVGSSFVSRFPFFSIPSSLPIAISSQTSISFRQSYRCQAPSILGCSSLWMVGWMHHAGREEPVRQHRGRGRSRPG